MDPIEASQLITDEYSAKILIATFKRKLSAQGLSEKCGIPIAACYRKIRTLIDSGLLEEVDRILTQKGKRKSIYTSRLKSALIFYEGGKLKVRFELNTGIVKEFGSDSYEAQS
ncbi:MAG: helix-turn-helix transcriptional regulator [Thermoplasmata archaeon]|nr:helix-turn-helix transcriptional regulator [Thermoplasmata archaeon]